MKNPKIRVQCSGDLATVFAPTNLDAAVVPRFSETLGLLAQPAIRKVNVDLAATIFMDSAGVGFLVSVLKQMRERSGRMTVRNASGQPGKLLRQLQFDKAVEFL